MTNTQKNNHHRLFILTELSWVPLLLADLFAAAQAECPEPSVILVLANQCTITCPGGETSARDAAAVDKRGLHGGAEGGAPEPAPRAGAAGMLLRDPEMKEMPLAEGGGRRAEGGGRRAEGGARRPWDTHVGSARGVGWVWSSGGHRDTHFHRSWGRWGQV